MAEDWEEKMLEQMAEMFKNMGMEIDMPQLRKLMEQFRSQFDDMGLDAERLAKGDVNFNFDISNLMKLFQSGMPLEEMLSNMGVNVKVDANPVEVDIDDSPKETVVKLPVEDVYLSGWNMSITVDFATRADMEEIEIALSSGGDAIQVLSDPSNPPLAQIELPHKCDDVVDWSMNNGILDITLKLTPQGSAADDSEILDDEVDDDYFPESTDVSLDVADDDDDEDDGGIPIL